MGGKGGPAWLCLSGLVLETGRCSCMSVAVLLLQRGVQEIALSPSPFVLRIPLVSAGPAAASALRPAPSSCPVPQRIPGISALASRLSQPRSPHERPFPPAGSGRVPARSHRSSRSVAVVTLLPVPESPGRCPHPSAGPAWYPLAFPSPKPHPSSRPPSLTFLG